MSGRITATGRVQRLLAMLQWAAGHAEGVPVEQVCERFDLRHEDLVRELDLASMIGADSSHYDEMPFEVFVEDGSVFVRLFSFRRPMRLTPAEGLALVAAADVLVDRAGPEGRGGPLDRALAKLSELLGIEPGATFDVDLDPDGGPTGQTIRSAIDQGRPVAFTYWTYGRDVVAPRVVDPWDLVAAEGQWYLIGWAHDAEAQRHFRLDRIDDLVIADEPVRRPRPKQIERTVGVGDDAPTVVLDLGPGARWVADAHPVLDAQVLDDDRLRVTLAVTGQRWLERLLLRLGPDVEVVEIDPALGDPSLGAAAAARVLARYAAPDGGEGGPSEAAR